MQIGNYKNVYTDICAWLIDYHLYGEKISSNLLEILKQNLEEMFPMCILIHVTGNIFSNIPYLKIYIYIQSWEC